MNGESEKTSRPRPQQPEPKFRRRAEARPDEVLDAALALFSEQGYAKTTVEAIARKAGLSKGAVYLYFPSKQALLVGLVRRALAPTADVVIRTLNDWKGDPRPAIRNVMTGLMQRMADPHIFAVPKLVIREAVNAPEIAAIYRAELIDRALPALAGLIERGVAAGHIRPVDPELTVRSVIGPVMLHLALAEVFGVVPRGGLNLQGLVENHLEILFAGLEPEREVKHDE